MGETIEAVGGIIILLVLLFGLGSIDYVLWVAGGWFLAVLITSMLIGIFLIAIGRHWND